MGGWTDGRTGGRRITDPLVEGSGLALSDGSAGAQELSDGSLRVAAKVVDGSDSESDCSDKGIVASDILLIKRNVHRVSG